MATSAAELAALTNQRMRELDIGQQELSRRSGVSVATLRRLQRGVEQRRNPATLAAISKALEWPENYLRDLGKPGEGKTDSSALEDRVAALESEVRDIRASLPRGGDGSAGPQPR